MNSIDLSKGVLEESDGVFTLKNKNTTLGFVRFNNIGEIEYIFVNPLFRKKNSGIRIYFLLLSIPNFLLCLNLITTIATAISKIATDS